MDISRNFKFNWPDPHAIDVVLFNDFKLTLNVKLLKGFLLKKLKFEYK
jgi:hypothetical protein